MELPKNPKFIATGEENKNMELYCSLQRKHYPLFYHLPMNKVLRETMMEIPKHQQYDDSTSTDEDNLELSIFKTSKDYKVHMHQL